MSDAKGRKRPLFFPIGLKIYPHLISHTRNRVYLRAKTLVCEWLSEKRVIIYKLLVMKIASSGEAVCGINYPKEMNNDNWLRY